jgi:hypothetical protein
MTQRVKILTDLDLRTRIDRCEFSLPAGSDDRRPVPA